MNYLILALCFCLFLASVFPRVSIARTLQVGPEREFKSLSAAASLLEPGDVVEIDSGVYREVLRLAANGTREAPIIIRGVGKSRPVFDAQDIDTSGVGKIPRGIFQIEGAYIVVEHLEFKNARNGENSAGIRLLDSTNAVIRDCKISYCDMGIFGGDRETTLIENSEICFNSTQQHNGYAHNFYMSGNRVVVRNCLIHDCPFGQNFKSRAHYNELWNNRIAYSNEGEIGIVDAENDTERANSHALLVGNVVVSANERSGNNWKFILFGSESGHAHDGTLFLFHNTFIAGNEKIKFITLADAKASAVIRNNVFIGSAQIMNEMQPPLSMIASDNAIIGNSLLPENWADVSTAPLNYIDGEGAKQTLVMEARSTPAM